MNIIHRTNDRVLLSLTSTEVEVIEQALSLGASSSRAPECLALLREQLGSRPVSEQPEIVSVWTDGASVQVRAITVHADPVDMGEAEARAFAHRILKCASEAD
jgi:hypothetical protein